MPFNKHKIVIKAADKYLIILLPEKYLNQSLFSF